MTRKKILTSSIKTIRNKSLEEGLRVTYIKLLLYTLLLIKTVSAFAEQSWPSLFTKDDFYPGKFDKFKDLLLKKRNTSFFNEANTRKQILDSFYFIVDFVSDTKGDTPLDWEKKHIHINDKLILGKSTFPPSDQPRVFFPIFKSNKIAYIKGDNLFTNFANSFIDLMIRKEFQNALDILVNFRVDLKLNNKTISQEEESILNFLIGTYFLQATADAKKKKIEYFNYKGVKINLNPRDSFQKARSFFWSFSKIPNEFITISLKNAKINKDFFYAFRKDPLFFENKNTFFDKYHDIQALPDSLSKSSWLASVLLSGLWNCAILNGNTNHWSRAYTCLEKIELVEKSLNFEETLETSDALKTTNPKRVDSKIYLTPHSQADFKATFLLYKAHTMTLNRDFLKALSLYSQAILSAKNPEIQGLGFYLAGVNYYKMNILKLAKKSFSWSELVSRKFTELVPATLFYGATSAFWQGNYDIAIKGFKKFLANSGDSNYGPWARLKIGEACQVLGKKDKSITIYETLLRNHSKHPAASEARSRLFCMNLKNLPYRTRIFEYEKIKKSKFNSESKAIQQRDTCLLEAELITLTDYSFLKKNPETYLNSKSQLNYIENFRDKYKDSPFLSLFQDRIKALNLAIFHDYEVKKNCQKLVAFYKKNKKDLKWLSHYNNKYLKGLKWDYDDKISTLKCSAILGDVESWKDFTNIKLTKQNAKFNRDLYSINKSPSVSSALSLFQNIINEEDWLQRVEEKESKANNFISDNDFWKALAIENFMKYTLNLKKSGHVIFNEFIKKIILNKPQSIFHQKEVCLILLEAKDSLTKSDYDNIMEAQSSEAWLKLLQEKKNSCLKHIAKLLVKSSLRLPSPMRDKSLLMPLLKIKSIKDAPFLWLDYAKRLEKEKTTEKKTLISMYGKIYKESNNALVKEDAKLWLESQKEPLSELFWD